MSHIPDHVPQLIGSQLFCHFFILFDDSRELLLDDKAADILQLIG
eukprot:gene22082-16523_t